MKYLQGTTKAKETFDTDPGECSIATVSAEVSPTRVLGDEGDRQDPRPHRRASHQGRRPEDIPRGVLHSVIQGREQPPPCRAARIGHLHL